MEESERVMEGGVSYLDARFLTMIADSELVCSSNLRCWVMLKFRGSRYRNLSERKERHRVESPETTLTKLVPR